MDVSVALGIVVAFAASGAAAFDPRMGVRSPLYPLNWRLGPMYPREI